MRIVDIEVSPISLPMKQPLRMAMATVSNRTSILVRVTADNGAIGLGEAVVAPYFTGETLVSATHLIRDMIAPSMIDRDPGDIDALRQLMSNIAVGNQAGKCAMEMALHDLMARIQGIPLYERYGGRVRVDVPTIWHVSGTEPREMATSAASAVEESGYTIVKVKVGDDVDTDIAKTTSVRGAVGPDVRIVADANQGFDVESALRFSTGVAELDIAFLEQPVHASDMIGMAVVNGGPVPVAGDEGVFDAAQLESHVALEAIDVVVVKPMKSAGPLGTREVLDAADKSGIGIHFAGMPGQSSIGAAHALHLASAAPTLRFGAGICPYYLEADIVTEPISVSAGHLRAPSGAGIGVDLDEDALDRYTVRL